jgi:DNA gyrase/topoisomerase IV subunit B
MLAEARMRREEVGRKNKEKNLQLISLECDKEDIDLEEGNETEISHVEGDSSGSNQESGKMRKPRKVVQRKKRVILQKENHEDSMLKYKRVGGVKGEGNS